MNFVYFLRFCISYPKDPINIPEYRCLLIDRVHYTVLVHKRTCCGKYRISQVSIDFCNSLISDANYKAKSIEYKEGAIGFPYTLP